APLLVNIILPDEQDKIGTSNLVTSNPPPLDH
ncbi:unnamed protein product, partial [Adineta steineri]